MRTVRTTFEVVQVKATKRWTDAAGKKRQETRTFMQTLNPWNVSESGRPKTRERIEREIREERDAWLKEPQA